MEHLSLLNFTKRHAFGLAPYLRLQLKSMQLIRETLSCPLGSDVERFRACRADRRGVFAFYDL